MTKQRIVEILKEKGYNAGLEDNLPTVHIKKEELTKTQMQALFRENGYQGSFRFVLIPN